MIEANKKVVIMPESEQLKQIAMEWNVGEIKYHEDIANMVFLNSQTNKYYNVMKKTIKLLTKIGIRLKNIRGVGYKVLTADEWVDEAKRYINKTNSAVSEAQEIINNAPIMKMSEEKQKECILLHDRIVRHRYLLSGGVKKIEIEEKTNIKKIREGWN